MKRVLRRSPRQLVRRRHIANGLAADTSDDRLLLRSLKNGVKNYAIFVMDTAGQVLSWNAGAAQIQGYSANEIVGRHFSAFYPPDDVALGHPRDSLRIAALNGAVEDEGWLLRKDGSRFWADVLITALRNDAGQLEGFSNITRDGSARKLVEDKLRLRQGRTRTLMETLPGLVGRIEKIVRDRTAQLRLAMERLERALAEKTVLLKEVHHRVKNNLAVVSSLLAMQASTVSDPSAIAALEESQRRIHSMALIHEQLYGSERLSQIDFSDYANQLASELLNAYGLASRVKVRCRVEPFSIGVHRAIPFGLILNELLSNAMKYAYPGERSGTIDVSFRVREDGSQVLQVEDDGVGISSDVRWRKPQSLGLEIVQILAKQLDGVLDVRKQPGACFSIVFHAANRLSVDPPVSVKPPDFEPTTQAIPELENA